jgi:predicted dehydrogenase
LARWLMADEVVEVHAWGSLLAHPHLAAVGDVDSAVVALRLAGGAVGTVELARSNVPGDEVRTEVLGTSGAVHVGERLVVGEVREPIFESAYAAQARGFVRAIADDAPVEVGGAEARAAFAIALAARRSLHEGRPVSVTTL